MRTLFLSVSLVCTLSVAIAAAQTPAAYVYVAEDFRPSGQLISSPITVYATSSAGKLTEVEGSPFRQVSGSMVGTNGSHFLTLDDNVNTTHQYLHVYDVASNGVLGKEVSKLDMHEWCRLNEGAILDHRGQFVYVTDKGECGGATQSFAVSKSGELTFEGSLDAEPVVFSGDDKFAYSLTPAPGSDYPCPTDTLIGFGRESSGALRNIDFSQIDPTPPVGYDVFESVFVTDDPTNHLASMVYYGDNDCFESPSQLASYTIESNGDLVSTNTFEDMPTLAGPSGVAGMKLNPAGDILAVSVGTGIQFFHFNGAAPITEFTGIIGTTGFISDMTWDRHNHLYALNGQSGRLHIYTATPKSVVEAEGSPYLPPNSCSSGACSPSSVTDRNLVVRSVP